VRASVQSRQSFIDSARANLDKRRNEARYRLDERRLGPQGESRSQAIAKRLELIPLSQIYDDPEFTNLRLITDDEDLQNLTESMKYEGLKVPITVICSPGNTHGYYVRAGFRRTTVARRLEWEKIPAVILPDDTPAIEEYWTNIIENSARSKLTTYEIACAARTMREKFDIRPNYFAARAGYSESYVVNLLRCIDRLPPEIIEEWKDRAPIPVDHYINWSKFEPEEAIKMMLSYKNRHPQITRDWKPSAETRKRVAVLRMASPEGLARMQRLRFAVEVARQLTPENRNLCLRIIDFCSGGRMDVPGIYDPAAKQRMYKSRRQQDVVLPPPGEPLPAITVHDLKRND